MQPRAGAGAPVTEEGEASMVRKGKDCALKTDAVSWGERKQLPRRYEKARGRRGGRDREPKAEEARAEADPRQVRTGTQP